jgi:hypothetical protein
MVGAGLGGVGAAAGAVAQALNIAAARDKSRIRMLANMPVESLAGNACQLAMSAL